MIQLLSKDLEYTCRSLLEVTIKNIFLQKCKEGNQLRKIDLSDASNHLEKKKNPSRICCSARIEYYLKKNN